MRVNYRIGVLLLSLLYGAVIQATEQPLGDYQVKVLGKALEFPWAVVELPDGRLLVSEKVGRLNLIATDGQKVSLSGIPDVFAQGQGGLMDVVLHPDYANNGWLYLSFAQGNAQANHLQVIRAQLDGTRLVHTETIFSASPDKATPVHYGARMAFLPDHSLVIASGDGFDYREQAQNPANHLGKLIRVKDDGSSPADNPSFEGGVAGLYSLGHRNPQGLAWDPVRRQLFANEHGPAGGDEINLIIGGLNYGWPVITEGKDYSGANISPFRAYPGMQPPLVDWTPSIAPSALVVYRGEMFPELRGDLLSTTLKSQEVRRVVLSGENIVRQERLFTELESRLRDIHIGSRGQLFLLTDGPQGQLLVVER